MAGGHHFPYPKWVWSPAGGWWPKPAQWKRDTVIFGAFAALALFAGYRYTEANTVAYYPRPVPTHLPKGSSHGH